MEQIQLVIGRALFIGVLISLLLVAAGLGIFLFHHSTEIIHFQTFQSDRKFIILPNIFVHGFIFSGRELIQLGLIILLLIQVLRVILTAWFFKKIHDPVFVWISLFILAIMIYSLIRL